MPRARLQQVKLGLEAKPLHTHRPSPGQDSVLGGPRVSREAGLRTVQDQEDRKHGTQILAVSQTHFELQFL